MDDLRVSFLFCFRSLNFISRCMIFFSMKITVGNHVHNVCYLSFYVRTLFFTIGHRMRLTWKISFLAFVVFDNNLSACIIALEKPIIYQFISLSVLKFFPWHYLVKGNKKNKSPSFMCLVIFAVPAIGRCE